VSEFRLLERVACWESGTARSNVTRASALIDSVIAHLRCILNTRQGSVPLDPLFGVPDFTNLAGGLSAGSVRDIEVSIRQVITRYEPRLRAPQVALRADAGDPMSLRFDVDGRLEVDGQEIPLQLSTIVGGNGKISVPDQALRH
jgi:type VI secretion system protein